MNKSKTVDNRLHRDPSSMRPWYIYIYNNIICVYVYPSQLLYYIMLLYDRGMWLYTVVDDFQREQTEEGDNQSMAKTHTQPFDGNSMSAIVFVLNIRRVLMSQVYLTDYSWSTKIEYKLNQFLFTCFNFIFNSVSHVPYARGRHV